MLAIVVVLWISILICHSELRCTSIEYIVIHGLPSSPCFEKSIQRQSNIPLVLPLGSYTRTALFSANISDPECRGLTDSHTYTEVILELEHDTDTDKMEFVLEVMGWLQDIPLVELNVPVGAGESADGVRVFGVSRAAVVPHALPFRMLSSSKSNAGIDTSDLQLPMSYRLVSRTLEDAGFHRRITTVVELENMEVEDATRLGLRFLLVERVTEGLFVDLDELQREEEQAGHSLFKILNEGVIDIEKNKDQWNKPVYVEVSPQSSSSRSQFTFSLPVHGRYHRASSVTRFASVWINEPVLVVVHNEWGRVYVRQERPEGEEEPLQLEMRIPVGDLKQRWLVDGVTMAVTFGMSLLIIYALFRS